MRYPLAAKSLALAAVLLGLTWSLAMVSDLVREREARLREAQQGLADSLAESQMLAGPVIQRQCTQEWQEPQGEGKERRLVEQRREFTLIAVPKQLDIDASTQVESRARGIFRINGYVLKGTLQAGWSDLTALRPEPPAAGVKQHCAAPVLWTALRDARGIRSARIAINGVAVPVQAGTPAPNTPRGFQAPWPNDKPFDPQAAVKASVTLELVGTESLTFSPMGQQSHVRLTSDWPHPSFNGRFLPTQRTVSEQGFEAQWRLSSLASHSGADLAAGLALCQTPESRTPCIESFGVSFIDPVSTYVLSDRATKYGLLFIILTFVAVGMVEVLRAVRVHPIQYGLVGCALALFFLLLVSLSEHIGFALAYAAAATACTLLLGYYGAHVLQGIKAGVGFASGVGGLFGLLYLLLLSEQSSLMLGSVLLFVVLAVVMLATRRIDWYAMLERLRSPTQTRPGTAGSPQ